MKRVIKTHHRANLFNVHVRKIQVLTRFLNAELIKLLVG